MAKAKKVILGILGGLITIVAIGGVAKVCDDAYGWVDKLIGEQEKVVDDSRVSVTMYGTHESKWTYAYVFFNHPDLEDAYVPNSWPGIMPKAVVNTDGFDYVTYNGDNSYTIELTGLLPLEYDDFGEFIEDGGSCGLIVSYATADNLGTIQSADISIEESGNHYVSMPTENYGSVTHRIVKYEKLGNVEDTETEDKESTENSSDETDDSTSTETEDSTTSE